MSYCVFQILNWAVFTKMTTIVYINKVLSDNLS